MTTADAALIMRRYRDALDRHDPLAVEIDADRPLAKSDAAPAPSRLEEQARKIYEITFSIEPFGARPPPVDRLRRQWILCCRHGSIGWNEGTVDLDRRGAPC